MKKTRVLHIANKMDLGGVERWLLGVAEELKGTDIELDILVHSPEPGVLDTQFKENGVNIIPCVGHKNIIKYIFNFVNILKKNGPYDVVHSHVLYFSGVALLAAWIAKVPIRVSHAHSNRTDIEPKKGVRALYINAMKKLIKYFATRYVAVSNEAHKSIHTNNVDDKNLEILYCGIKHLNKVNIDLSLRDHLGIPSESLVMGHVGRMSEPKNHQFILEIFKALQKHTRCTLVLIGDGELRDHIEKQAKNMNIKNDILFLGSRSDAVDVMASTFDFIAFPSLYEGLPLTVVEAQAVGVPIIVANNITKEAEFNSNLVQYMSLNDTTDRKSVV